MPSLYQPSPGSAFASTFQVMVWSAFSQLPLPMVLYTMCFGSEGEMALVELS